MRFNFKNIKKSLHSFFFIIIMLIILVRVPQAQEYHWYKGNTHAHTLNSDGNLPPDEMVKWYREHGYNFIVITDHNYVTNVEGLNTIFGMENRFLVMTGEEINCLSKNASGYSYCGFVNAINVPKTVVPQKGETQIQSLQNNIDAVLALNGIAQINHPNYLWLISPETLVSLQGYSLLEIADMHPEINGYGGGGFPGHEEIWDIVLSKGKKVFGIASDDTHNYTEFAPHIANPGRGWIWVKCETLTANNIAKALQQGDFYGSTGVILEDISFNQNSLTIKIKPSLDAKVTVEFIGLNGIVLEKTYDNPTSYAIKGNETYIRVRITDSNGFKAWTQPVFVK